MITTVTPNPCFDKTYTVPQFDLYRMNRVRALRNDIGGKGINVSAALHNMGAEVRTAGLQFADSAAIQQKFMISNGLNWDFVEVPGALRTCIKIFDESLKHTVEINEAGEPVPEWAADMLLERALLAAKESSVIVFAGSLPSGFPEDFYYRCAAKIKREAPECRIVVDAEKKQLLKALAAAPAFIKPNIHEFCDTFGVKAGNIAELDAAARKVVKQYGLEFICVSKGADGAYISDGREAFFCTNPPVEVRSIQGAGDSVVAGICLALEKSLPLPEILRMGIACAAASISREGTLLCTPELVQDMLARPMELVKLG